MPMLSRSSKPRIQSTAEKHIKMQELCADFKMDFIEGTMPNFPQKTVGYALTIRRKWFSVSLEAR